MRRLLLLAVLLAACRHDDKAETRREREAELPRVTSPPHRERPPARPGSPEETQERLALVQRGLEQSRRDSFDPKAVVGAVGRDPAALLHFVRDYTRLVPYRGTLKGGTGVLLDRAGNSLDRALLLTTLLDLAGQRARLAHATLGPTELAIAEAATRRIPRAPPLRRAPTEHELERGEAGGDGHEEEPPPSVGRALLEEARGRADKAPPAPGEPPVPAARASGEPLRDHWWAQVQRPQGGWVDLDPTAEAAEPGQGLIGFSETLPPAQLPAELRHQVDVALVASGAGGDRLLGRRSLAPADLFATPLVVGLAPAAPILYKDLDRSLNWIPVLGIGRSEQRFAAFSMQGVDSIFVELVVRAPGEPERRVRRRLPDRAALLDVLLLAATPSPEFVDYLLAIEALAARDGRLAPAAADPTGELRRLARPTDRLPQRARPLYLLALARAAWGHLGHEAFIDRIQILALEHHGCDRAVLLAGEVGVVDGDPAKIAAEQRVADRKAVAAFSNCPR